MGGRRNGIASLGQRTVVSAAELTNAHARAHVANRIYLADGNRLDLEANDAMHPETLQPNPSLADTLIDKLRRSGRQQLANELQADHDLAERLARRLHDLETHRQQQERELDQDLGIGLGL